MMNKSFIGFHYDIARGAYLKPDVFCSALRLAAKSGYTHFLPYLENMIRLPSMERACPSCVYTVEDWKIFEAVANEAGIELVPHFNVIGHTESIAPAYPELCGEKDGNRHQEIDVAKKDSREWMLRSLGEFCDFSHGKYFLIGGDEWQPPKHMLARSDFDVARSWANQINDAVELLVSRGRQPIVWHDMLVHYPAVRELLSRQAVIAFWFYDYDSDYAALSTFKNLGFSTLMATAVFDGALPMLGRRSVNALRQAGAAADRHSCDGIIVTSWESCRWELESYNIPMAAKVIGGEDPPASLTDTISRFGAWSKLPGDSSIAHQWRAEMEAMMNHPDWDSAPEMRRVLRAILRGDVQDNAASYIQYHYPQGRGYENASRAQVQSDWAAAVPAEAYVSNSAFGLKVVSDNRRGELLQFFNGEESFVVYPKFGASLQDWQCDGKTIILDSMESFLKRNMLPGGYRSYAAVGGFRPIWALGTHSNPCILWQYPWNWRISEQTRDNVAVELKLELPHGDFSIVITVERGKPGFAYEARCVNKLEHTYGAFNFNLPIPFSLDDLMNMKLVWNDDGKTHEMTVAGQAESAFWIPAGGPLEIRQTDRILHIDAAPEKTAGYFVDWNAGFVTPDLHGVYRPLKIGEETVTRWHLMIQTESLSSRRMTD
jgi:hypothetical protein